VENKGIVNVPAQGYCAKGTNSVPLLFSSSIIPYKDILVVFELGIGLQTPSGYMASVKITT